MAVVRKRRNFLGVVLYFEFCKRFVGEEMAKEKEAWLLYLDQKFKHIIRFLVLETGC
jgi:hypothetical protein